MKKEQYQVPMIEELDSSLLVAGATGMSNPDPDDNGGDI